MKRLARQFMILLAAAVIPASASAWLQRERGKWDVFQDHAVPISEILQWKQTVLWVDARSAIDFASAHIPGALRLTEDDWNELLPDLLNVWEPESIVVVYCSSRKCHASEEVAKRLWEEVGLRSVFVLRGGWEARKGAQR